MILCDRLDEEKEESMKCEAVWRIQSMPNIRRGHFERCTNDAEVYLVTPKDNILHGFCKDHRTWWPGGNPGAEYYFPTAAEVEVIKILND